VQIFFTRLVLGFLEYVNAAVSPTASVKLHGRGPRAEADAARPLPRRTPEEATRELQRPCRRDSSELTSRLGRRASTGPRQVLAGVSPRLAR
jgi:hypothetical protein